MSSYVQVGRAASSASRQYRFLPSKFCAVILLGLFITSKPLTTFATSKHLLKPTWKTYGSSTGNKSELHISKLPMAFALSRPADGMRSQTSTTKLEPERTPEESPFDNTNLQPYKAAFSLSDSTKESGPGIHDLVGTSPSTPYAGSMKAAYKSVISSTSEHSPTAFKPAKKPISSKSTNSGKLTAQTLTHHQLELSQPPQQPSSMKGGVQEGQSGGGETLPHGAMGKAVDGAVVDEPRRRSRRAATSDRNLLWPDGIIPYEMNLVLLSDWAKFAIVKAMREWEKETCLSFVERQPQHQSYLVFTVTPCGCCSRVGRRIPPAPQNISINGDCGGQRGVLHEIGHAIGFWHEHARPDRDASVVILKENILPKELYNFDAKQLQEVDSLGEPYDYDSIMHYKRTLFAKPDKAETIRPNDPKAIIGLIPHLSSGDIRQTNKLYKCPSCGRTLLQSAGTFSSPKIQSHLVEESFCQWRIRVELDEHISLHFTHMDMPSAVDSTQFGGVTLINTAEECKDEYVEVHDGYHGNSILLGRFCGSVLPSPFLSSGSRMRIDYKRAAGSASGGFVADYKVVCGGRIEGNGGTIVSPSFPNDYPPDRECLWKIEAPVGSFITLTFNAFSLEEQPECELDYVEIYEDLPGNSPPLQKLCGEEIPEPIRSTSNAVYVKFISDDTIQGQGFSASFQAERKRCNNTKHGCEHICVDTPSAYACECRDGHELQLDGKTCKVICGGNISAANGILLSPAFPEDYYSSQECIWSIRAPPKWVIFLNFTDFNVRKQKEICEKNFVRVYSGPQHNRRRQKTFCGAKLPPAVTSYNNKLTVAFHVDGFIKQDGFRATYLMDHDECADYNGGCEQICHNTIGSYFCSCRVGFKLYEQFRCSEESTVDARQ